MLIGLALVFLPGPAFIVIPAGLGILGIEFVWARRWMLKLSRKAGVEKHVRQVLGDAAKPPEADRASCGEQDR